MKQIFGKIKTFYEKLFYSIGMQITLVLVVTAVCFVLFAVINQEVLIGYSEQYEKEIDQYHMSLEVKKGFARSGNLFYDYIKTGDPAFLQEHYGEVAQASEYLNALSRADTGDDAAYLLVGMQQSLDSYSRTCDQAARLYQEGMTDYYNHLIYSQKINKYLQKYADELLQDILQDEIRASYELQKRQQFSVILNILVAVLITAVISSFCLYLYKTVTIPLNELAEKAREMSAGNLNVRVQEGRMKNNVATTSRAFNMMAEGVRNSMETERKKVEYEKLLNEARFMALQTQTNPHFLFNTLNSISRTITFGRYEQSQMMLEALAVLMRYNLTDAGIPVSIRQELEITNEYVKIQQMRFGSRISVEFRYDEELASRVRIPRFTLQPLVENSIVHGLEPKSQGGRMILDVKRVGTNTRIRICDDGVGIGRDSLQRLQQGMREQKSKRIGIWNTYQRITLFTGDPSSFRLMSKVGVGTMVVIKIPEKEWSLEKDKGGSL